MKRKFLTAFLSMVLAMISVSCHMIFAGSHKEMVALGINIACQRTVAVAHTAFEYQRFGIEDIDTLACKIRHIQFFAIVKEVGCIQRSAT